MSQGCFIGERCGLPSPDAAMPPVVLVVDDEPLVRWLAVETLQDLGCEVLEAQDAKQALAIIERNPAIALLFTDVRMPGSMDGVELVRAAKAINPELRAVITSGGTGYGCAGGSLIEGVPFLSKPYLPHALSAITLAELELRRPRPTAGAAPRR